MSTLEERLARQAAIEPRVRRLMAVFDGAIKYTPMLQDHGEGTRDPWTDAQCIAFARKWSDTAMRCLKVAVAMEKRGYGKIDKQHPRWNEGVPYCRNLPTADMLKDAGK